MTRSMLGALVLSGLPGLFWPVSAAADIWPVTVEGDHNDGLCGGTDCTLREALLAAGDGDTVNFAFASGDTQRTIAIGSSLPDIDSTVTIDGFDCTGCGGVNEHPSSTSVAGGLQRRLSRPRVVPASGRTVLEDLELHDGTGKLEAVG